MVFSPYRCVLRWLVDRVTQDVLATLSNICRYIIAQNRSLFAKHWLSPIVAALFRIVKCDIHQNTTHEPNSMQMCQSL